MFLYAIMFRIVNGVDEISGDISPSLQNVLLSKIPDDSEVTIGLQKKIMLWNWLPREMSLNIDTEDSLTKEASCVVQKFDFRVH